jgi:hypothetical protein
MKIAKSVSLGMINKFVCLLTDDTSVKYALIEMQALYSSPCLFSEKMSCSKSYPSRKSKRLIHSIYSDF